MKFAQPVWFNVLDTNADAQDVADATVAFAQTAAKLGGQPGVIYVPAGSYTLSGSLPTLVNGQSIIGDGSAATFINYTGSGTFLKAGLAGGASFTGGTYAGKIGGLYLSGYSAGASAVGVQLVDLQGFTVDDLAVYGFGGKGVYFTTSLGYSEEATVRARVVQCGTYGSATSGAVVFDSTSFDYGNFDFTIVSYPGTHGVVLQNGAQLRGVDFRVRGNFYARASANTGAVIALAPAGGSDTSYITDAKVDVAVESAGASGVGHTFVLLGSTNSASQFTGSGVLSFNPFGPSTIYSQGFSNAHFVPFGFSGYVQDGTQAGPPGSAGDALQIMGGINQYPNGTLSSKPGGGVDIYWQFGNVAEGQLSSGNNILAFHATTGGSVVRVCDLWLAQPSSGAAGTVTWPAGTKWPAGTPPTLSSTNGYVDHLRFTYLPDTGFWYGDLIGVHYS